MPYGNRFGGHPSAGARHTADLAKERQHRIDSGNARVLRSNLDDNARQFSNHEFDLATQQRLRDETPGIRNLSATPARSTSSETLDKGGHMSEQQDPAMKKIEEIQRTQRVSFTEAVLLFDRQDPEAAAAYRGRVLGLTEQRPTPTTMSATAPGSGSAIVKFDALVDSIKKKDPKLSYSDAILKAAREQPQLAKQRNAEILPVGPGGAVMMRNV
jgi:hypothetical protein